MIRRLIRRLAASTTETSWLCSGCNTHNPDNEPVCLTCGPAS
ncbi:hypothetical protein ACQUSR_05750 [Streptomyces sp. P1-3]